jgi:superoxide dismutase, Cu-Zn family
MIKHVTAAIALLAAPVVVLSGCSKPSATNESTTTSGSASNGKNLTTQLNAADGKHVADATIDFSNGFATVTVETVATGILSPGFHGLHIHQVGSCEANSAAPSGGPSGDFNSAGDHFQLPGHTGQPASGDLPPLLVRSDGSGKLIATSDAFTADALKSAQGSSIVLHQGVDMAEMQNPTDARIACGVLSPASSMSTSVSTSTSTVTTTAPSPAPPATVTETPSSSEAAPSSSAAPSTSTVTQTTITTTQIPIPIPTVPNQPGPNG